MPSKNAKNGQGNRNAKGGGPPPWAGSGGRHVERDGDRVRVGRSPTVEARETATQSSDQLERVEAKLDVLLAELEGQ